MAQPNPHRSNLVESNSIHRLCSGGNGADLTVEEGSGAQATVPRASEGVYTITISGQNPGTFKGWRFALGAATPDNVKAYTVVRDTPVAWDGDTWTMPFTVYASGTAADLIADEYIDIELVFGVSED